jgi:hypothetical protein
LNPTEYIWGHAKHHKLPNACPKDFAELKNGARHALRNMRRRPHPHHRLLETGFLVVRMTLYYAELSRQVLQGQMT